MGFGGRTALRLLRVQFTPIMIAPVVLGTAVAWRSGYVIDAGLFLLALLGSVSLHLAANGIDDVYDYVNGTDKIANEVFPTEAPGWKPVARGMISVGQASAVSYSMYAISIVIGIALSLLVGWYALLIAIPGILLSYFYTAPPLRLDYRGLGLGELSILFSFGPIPALGVFYVLTRQISSAPFLLALPSGMLTAGILISHDLIFFDVYNKAGKRSLAVVLGRHYSAILSSLIPGGSYVLAALFVAARLAPAGCLLVFLTLPLYFRFADFRGKERTPPEYGSRTTLVFLHSVAFTLLMAAGFTLG